MPEPVELTPIGRVESTLTDPASAPKQGFEGAPDAWLAFDDSVADALDGRRAGDRLIVLTWLDRARRDVLRVHPRDDAPIRCAECSARARPIARTRSACTRWR